MSEDLQLNSQALSLNQKQIMHHKRAAKFSSTLDSWMNMGGQNKKLKSNQ